MSEISLNGVDVDTRLKEVGAKTKTTSFHSFRHTWRDALRDTGVSRERVHALGGWAGDGGVADAYGSGFKASTLYEEIVKLEYADLDLTHLYPLS